LKTTLQELPESTVVILMGDWNSPLNPIDSDNKKLQFHSHSTNLVKQLLNKNNHIPLIDIFRKKEVEPH
jgi:exonuclease III